MQTHLLRDLEAARPWEEALRSVPSPTPFNGWSFIRACLDAPSDAHRPFLILVTDEARRPLALAPWAIIRGPHGLRELTGIGGEDGWYHDPLIARGPLDEALAAQLVQALRSCRSEWDVLQLELRQEGNSVLIRALQGLGVSASEHVTWRQNQTVHVTDWASYWKARPSQYRGLIRRRGQKLAALPHRFLEADHESLQPLLETLFALHRQQWRDERDWDPYYAKIRAIAADALDSGRLCFFALEVEGQAIALELLIRCQDQAFELMRITHPHPDYEPLSAGSLLTAWALEQMVARDIRTLNLGPGHHPWKGFLETGQTPAVSLVVTQPSRLPSLLLPPRHAYLKPYLRSLRGIREVAHLLKPWRQAPGAPLPQA